MSNFVTSSHFRRWLFDPIEFEKIQRESITLVTEQISKGNFDANKPRFPVEESGKYSSYLCDADFIFPSVPNNALSIKSNHNNAQTESHSSIGVANSEELMVIDQKIKTEAELTNGDSHIKAFYLTPQEESLLKTFYCSKIQQLCGRTTEELKLRRSSKVQATAITFFKRFYLTNSVMGHDPRVMMLTCIFLASKIEEEIIIAHDLENETDIREMEILRMELVLLQGLRFELRTYHPYRTALGFIEDMRVHFGEQERSYVQKLQLLYDRAQQLFDKMLVCSNVMFFHPPAHLAIAGLLMAAEDPCFSNIEISRYLREKFSHDARFSELQTTLQLITTTLREDMEAFDSIQKKQLKEILKKAKNCSPWSKSSSQPRKAKKQKVEKGGESNNAAITESK